MLTSSKKVIFGILISTAIILLFIGLIIFEGTVENTYGVALGLGVSLLIVLLVAFFFQLLLFKKFLQVLLNRHQTFFDGIPEVLLVLDKEGMIQECNLKAEKLFGKDKDDIVNKPMIDFHNKLDCDKAQLLSIIAQPGDYKFNSLKLSVVELQQHLFIVFLYEPE